MNARASFKRMQDSTREDWQLIGGEFMQFAGGLPARVIKHLQILEGDYGGFPIDRYSHSLQTATRALRELHELAADQFPVVLRAVLHADEIRSGIHRVSPWIFVGGGPL